MGSICLSTAVAPSKSLPLFSASSSGTSHHFSSSTTCSSSQSYSCRCSLFSLPLLASRRVAVTQRLVRRTMKQKKTVCMAPEEEKLTRRNPLDFPIEWDRPKPGRRPDIFPQFSPMKTPLPLPLPYDPPEEDDEEEEKKEEEEEDPDKEEQEGDKQQ